MELQALTRAVSAGMAACELTHQPRVPIDVAVAAAQHDAYARALETLGCTVHRLASPPDLPDAVFVEDTAVVLDEIAIVMRPGAESRRPETAAVEEWLKHRLLLGRIDPPATMDGGDALVVGRRVFVGVTARTNREGLEQFRRIVEYFGYTVTPLEVRGCLHLKSAVTAVDDDTLLINRGRLSDGGALDGYRLVEVHPDEPAAANVVRVGDRLLYAAAFPRTLERLAATGHVVTTVEVGELAKAEGAVTCCSVIFRPLET